MTVRCLHLRSLWIDPSCLWALICLLLALGMPQPASGKFVNVSGAAGVARTDLTYGAGWGDLDSDGDLDLLVGRHFLRPTIYSNLGSGSFTTSFGVVPFNEADHHGAVLFDIDEDGDLDLYVTGGAEGGTGATTKYLYRNDGGFAFRNIALEAGLADSSARGRSCSVMDVNGDGTADIFVANAKRASDPNSLFLGDGAGHFLDIAASAGVADAFGSIGSVWGDFDRDGDPDLFLSGEESGSETRFYRNEGNLTFADVTASVFPGIGQVTSAAWGDYDKDGDLDLVVGRGDEGLFDGAEWDGDAISFFFNARDDENGVDGIDFRNTGDTATFNLYFRGFFVPNAIFIGQDGHHPVASPFTVSSEEAAGSPTFVSGESIGFFLWKDAAANRWRVRCSTPAAIGSNFAGTITADGTIHNVAITDSEPYFPGPRGARLWRNDGDVFTDVSLSAGISDDGNVRHVTWVDYDCDGDLDLHVLNKGDAALQNEPDVLYRNQDGSFNDVTNGQKAEGPTAGLADGCSFEDFDGDGDLDLALTSGAPPRFFALGQSHYLYRNDAQDRNHLRVDLEGTLSAKDGYGAWVTCVSGSSGRQTHYVTGNAWRGSMVMLDPYFGLGSSTVVDSLIVEWPSGVVSRLADFPAGDVLVVESDSSATDAPALAEELDEIRFSARPNPSTGTISFHVGPRRPGAGTLSIFDTSGRLLFRTQASDPAREQIRWNGRDSQGRRVAPGVYHALWRDGNTSAVTKVVVVQ